MTSEKQLLIYKLRRAVDLLTAQKNEDQLQKDDLASLSTAIKYFGDTYHFESYSKFIQNLPVSAITDYISALEKEEQEETEKEKKKEIKKEKETEIEGGSLPPDLESLVAEYRQNQAILAEENIQKNQQRSVAEQVKIAIAHSQIKKRAEANRLQRTSQGEKFQDTDTAFISLGSPKSESKKEALSFSFQAVQEIALTHAGFARLSPATQEQIVSTAVELNSVCVTNIDVAIQSAALLLDTSDLSSAEQKQVAGLSSNFIHSVYDAVNTQTEQAATYEAQIAENEVVLLQLEKEAQSLTGKNLEAKQLQIKNLTATNQQLAKKIDSLPGQFNLFIDNQTVDFRKFENESISRLTQDPDLKDLVENANKNIASIHHNLETGGVKPHIYSSIDDIHLLEEAIRHDLPGELRPHATYEAAQAAALVDTPQTQNPDLSPDSIRLYSQNLTPKLLAKARQFAQTNPQSALGKLFQKRQDLFGSANQQIRKISQSPLGKEILKVSSGIGKFFSKISGGLNKITSRIPGGFGRIVNLASDPWGALRSWAGRKAGEYIARQIVQRLTNETLKKVAGTLLKEGFKGSVKKLAEQAAAKVAAKVALKLGIQAAASSTGVGVIVAVAIEVASWVFDKVSGAIKKLSIAVYGEEIKARDFIAAPVTGIAAVGTAVGSFFVALGTATATAAASAVGIITAGVAVGIFFYLTSIAVAPLISTLVQLEGTPKKIGVIITGCAGWPTDGQYTVGQGPLGSCTHTRGVQGIDVEAPENSSMIAVAPGTVSFAGNLGNVYGNYVIISSETPAGNTAIWYAHLNEIGVSEGNQVEVGTEIGLVGGTGGWEPHIHIEYRGISYNSCPSGDIPVPESCCNYGGETCTYNGEKIISNQTTP